MAICTYLAPNGEKSILAAALEQKYGPDVTARLWNYVRANMDKFKERDVNGEPVLAEVEKLVPIPPQIKAPLAKSIASDYKIENQDTRILQNINGKATLAQMDRLFVPIVNAAGEKTGNFDPQKQLEAVNSVLYIVQAQLNKGTGITPGFALQHALRLFNAGATSSNVPETRQQDFRNIVNSYSFNPELGRVSIAELALSQLESYGLKVQNKDAALIALEKVKNGILGKGTGADSVNMDIEDFSDVARILDEDAFTEEEGETLQNFNDISFQLDPRDTASWRMKMFMATLEKEEYATYRAADKPGPDTFDLADKIPVLKKEGMDMGLEIKDWVEKNPVQADKLARLMNRKGTYHPDPGVATAAVDVFKAYRPTAGITNHLGMPELANFNVVYESVLGATADTAPTYDAKKEALMKASDTQPVFKTIVKKLDASDESLQNEFTKVMSLHATNYTMTTFNRYTRDDQEHWILNSFDANRSSQVLQTIENWRQAQKIAPITVVKDGQRILDTQRMQGKARSWLLAFDAIDKLRGNNRDAKLLQTVDTNLAVVGKSRADVVNNLQDYKISATRNILALHGIQFTDQMAEQLLKFNPGAFDMDGATPKGILAKFIWKAGGNKTGTNTVEETDASEPSPIKESNPLYTEPATMRELAKAYLAFAEPTTTSSMRNAEGKTVFSYTLNTALTKRWSELANLPSDEELYKLYPGNNTIEGRRQAYRENIIAQANQVLISKDNYLLRQRAFENGKLSQVDGLKSVWSKKGVTRTAMSDREQQLIALSMFQNRGKAKASYISLAHSDKVTTPVYQNFPRMKVGGGTSTTAQAIDEMYKIFLAEYDRVRTHWDEDFNHAQYQTGKRLFFLLPQFNYDALQSRVGTFLKSENRIISQQDVDSIWAGDGDGRRIHNDVNQNGKKVIRGLLQEHIENLTNSTLEAWRKAGITDAEERSYAFDRSYVNKVLRDQGYLGWNYSKEDKAWKDAQDNVKSIDDVFDGVTVTAARDFAVNYFLVNSNMAQLFFGDPAEATKPGNSTMEIVDKTMKDYAKRLAKDIAPGQDLHWAKPTYQSITLADVTTSDNYIKDENLRKAYSKVDATDAQEKITVQEKLNEMLAAGVIKKDLYTEMSAEIKPGQYYEFTKPEHLAVILGPEKPVYVGNRPIDRGTRFTDYIKSSAYVLYPALTANSEVDHLRVAMEKNNVSRANYASAHKLGSPINPVVVFDADGNFNHAALTDKSWENATQTLNRSGFRIQQEVPYDEDKESIRTVTQMNTLITHGIELVKAPFNVPGFGDMTGAELRTHKENIRKQLIDLNLQKFYKDMGIAADENGVQVWHKDIVYSTLAEEARKRGYSENEISALKYKTPEGDLDIPLMLSTAVDKFESLMMSLVKDVVNIKMPGKSYVQASSVGYTRKQRKTEDQLTEADKRGIVYVAGHDQSKPLRTMSQDENGKTIPAQVLAPFNFLTKNGKANIKDYLVPGTNTLDLTRVPKELLQMVGARIPNQGHNSMLAIEIVGFIPDNLGDLIIVPSGITKQMGSDFDVDKLFTYRLPYRKNGNNFEVNRVEEGKDANEDQLKAQYFDTHWAVLTHPEMYDKVLQPLDKPDLAEEAKLLTPKQKGFYNYFDVQGQINDFQSGKYAKQLVALTSLSVVFNTVIQNKDLQLAFVEMVKGKDGRYVPTKVPRYIYIDGMTFSKLSGYGTSEYKGAVRTKQDNLTTLQSAAVDNAKNRTLDNLNLTPNTYPAVAAMMMLETDGGKALNLTYATRLLAQPVIKEFSRRMSETNDSMSEEYKADLKNTILKDLKDVLHQTSNIKEGEEEVKSDVELSPETMLQAYTSKRAGTPTEKQLHLQGAALDLFTQLDEIGTRLSELQSLFNQTTNGAGPNLMTTIDKEYKLDATLNGNLNSPIMNEDSIYNDTEQGNTFESTVGVASQLYTKLLPYNVLSNTIDRFRRETLSPNVSVDTQRQMLTALRSFMYASTHTLWNGASDERYRLMYNNPNSPSLARRVLAAQNSWAANDYFIQRLTAVIGDEQSAPDFVEFNSAKSATYDDNTNTNALMTLLNSTDREKKLLGEDLVRYAYLTGGIQDANNFVSKIPVSYLVDTEFSKELRELTSKLDPDSSFFTQFMQHNPDRAVQVKRDAFSNFITDGQSYPNIFIVDNIDENQRDVFKKLLTRDAEGNTKYPDYVSYRSKVDNKTILYKQDTNGTTYTRIDTLGNKATDEYNGDIRGWARSIFQENRSPATDQPVTDEVALLSRLSNDMKGLTENDSNQFENLGMPAEGGGYEVAETMLRTIQADHNIDTRLRTVASILEKSGEATIAAEDLGSIINKTTTLSVKYLNGDEGMVGRYYAISGELLLNPNVTDKKLAAETFLHELIHHRTAGIIKLAGFSNELNTLELPKELRTKVNAAIASFQEKHPETIKILNQIDRLRYEALVAFNGKLASGGKDYKSMMNQVEVGKYTTNDHLMLYGLSNTEEFVAHVLTDKNMAAFLNTVTNSKNRTFLQEVWDALSRLLLSVSEALGVNINRDSLLKEALTLSLKLTSLNTVHDAAININDAISENTGIQVQTEKEADAIKEGLEKHFDKLVTVKNSFTHLDMFVNNKPAGTIDTPPQIVKVLVKLREQEKELRLIISRVDTKTTAGQQTRRSLQADQRTLKDDIEDLRHKVEIGAIAEVGNKQMAWVETIMNKDNPTPQEIAVASKVLDLWSNIGETVYGGQAGLKEYNPQLGDLIVKAQATKTNSFAAKEMEALNHYLAGEEIQLTRQDYDSLKDMSTISQWTRGIETATSRVVSAIALVGKNAAEMRDEEIRNLGLRLDGLEKKMLNLVGGRRSALPDLYKSFLQENEDKTAWGFIQRYSPQWYSYTGTLSRNLDYQLDRAYNLEGAARKTAIKDAHRKYWTDLNKVGLFADTRILFDANTGELVDNEGATKEKELLLRHLGSQEHVDEVIQQAQVKYKQYLADREIEYDSIDKTTELTKDEIAGITLSETESKLSPEEQAALIEQKKKGLLSAKIANERIKWRSWNSPNVFFDSRYSNDTVNGFGSDKYTVMAPRVKNMKYYDSKYTSFQKKGNEAKMEILKDMLAIRDELLDVLPDPVKNKVGDNFLPTVTKETVTTMLGMLSSLKPSSMANKLFTKLTASKEEIDRQKTNTAIPITHIDTRPVHDLSEEEVRRRQEELSARSTDLPRVLDIFGRMALHYKHMSKVLDIVNTGESIIKEMNRARLNDTSKGEALTKTLSAMEYWKDTLFFRNAKKIEGVSNRAIYSANIKENARLTKEVKELVARRDALDAKFVDELLSPEEMTERNSIDDRLKEIASKGRYFAGSKGADVLVSFNQLRTLAYNPFAAVTNVSFAYISLWIYGNGRMDYSNKTLQQAHAVMAHAQKKYFLFGGVEDSTSKKIMNSMERSNLLSMTNDTTYGESNLKSRQTSTVRKALSPMNWQLSGDFYTKGLLMVAMMKHKMVSLSDGTKISLWDATGEDGYWDEKKYGARPDWAADDVVDQKSWNRFKAQLNKVSTMVFGNQDRNSPILAKKGMWGRLFGQFRLSWLPEGIAARWQPSREDLELGRTVKGRWRTYLDLGVFNSAAILVKQTLAAIPGVSIDPFSGVKDAKGKDISEVDIENMRRNIVGLAWTVAFTVTMLTAGHFLLPDENEKKRRRKLGLPQTQGQYRLLLNMLTRNYQDLTLYSSPGVLDTVLGNPIPVTSLITDSWNAMKATLNLMSSDPKAYEKWKRKNLKLLPVLSNFNKLEYMTTKDISQIGH